MLLLPGGTSCKVKESNEAVPRPKMMENVARGVTVKARSLALHRDTVAQLEHHGTT